MSATGYAVFESHKRFSQSVIWQVQKEFFIQQGVNAWNGQVPFYITSNPVIAHTYAEVMMRYVQDQLALGHIHPNEPVYIVEMGTGTGQFSFYCLQRLLQLQKTYRLDKLKICYLMTDFTDSNIQFWEMHPQFKPYLDQGVLDFAIFDGEASQELALLNQKITLSKGDIVNPLIVVANYLFDTLSHDVFLARAGVLYEALATHSTLASNVVDGKLQALKDIDTRFAQHLVQAEHYYPNPTLNTILATYQTQLKDGHFLFPVGGFTALETLRSLSHNQMLLLSTDKGYTELAEMEQRHAPSIVCHGSLSMNVNFHAIGEYFQLHQGEARHQTLRDTIRTSAFTLGTRLADLPHTQHALDTLVEGFSPGDFFNIHRHFRETAKIELKTLLSHLYLSHWDPYIFSVFIEKLNTEVPKASLVLKQGFAQGMMKYLIPQVYLTPGASDHYFNAGLLLHKMEYYQDALTCYRLSAQYQGPYFSAIYNQGLCLYHLDQLPEALPYLQQALTLKPDDAGAKEWLAHVEARLNQA